MDRSWNFVVCFTRERTRAPFSGGLGRCGEGGKQNKKRRGQGNLKSRRPNKKKLVHRNRRQLLSLLFFFETAAYIDRPQIQFPPPRLIILFPCLCNVDERVKVSNLPVVIVHAGEYFGGSLLAISRARTHALAQRSRHLTYFIASSKNG